MFEWLWYWLGYKDIDPQVEFDMLYPELREINKYFNSLEFNNI